MVARNDEFIPGDVWTPELIELARTRMLDTLATPTMTRVWDEAAVDEILADMATSTPPRDEDARPIDGTHCFIRRGRPDDIPRMAQMMLDADLPPLFIEEWLPGFAAVEHDGEIVGCGGAEIYGDSCVLRSIVIDPRARGLGLANTMSHLLMPDARAAGAVDAYLFTVDAFTFWQRLGFVDVPLDNWNAPPRQGWQYQYISAHPSAVAGIHSMWKRIDV